MFHEISRKCPVCGGHNGCSLHHQRFLLPVGHPLTSGYNVVCCGQCGFVYADISATQADYDLFYEKHSIYQNTTSSGGGETPWASERLTKTSQYIDRLIHDKTARILDIGCANGGLLKAFQSLGYKNLQGVDPSPACVENTRKCGVMASSGSLTALLSDLGCFDVVCLSHVLEHVLDMDVAVSAIRAVVKPGGICYVETPDALRYAPFLKAPFQDFNTEHINHFSIDALALTFRLRSGWSVVDSGTKEILSSPGNPFPACYTLLRRDDKETVWETPERDADLENATKEYIDASWQLLGQIESNIKSRIDLSESLLVWGTGQLCMKLLVETSLATANIISFVDGNPVNWGQSLNGVPIKSPKEIKDSHHPILIASLLNQEQIENDIRIKWGLTNSVIHLL
jgi:SAM-dependent methyltransferase